MKHNKSSLNALLTCRDLQSGKCKHSCVNTPYSHDKLNFANKMQDKEVLVRLNEFDLSDNKK